VLEEVDGIIGSDIGVVIRDDGVEEDGQVGAGVVLGIAPVVGVGPDRFPVAG
jgi:hypothetical protein